MRQPRAGHSSPDFPRQRQRWPGSRRTSYNYGAGAGSMLGAVVSQSSTNQTNGYVWSLRQAQGNRGALQKTITYDSNTLSSSNPIYTTTFTNDELGQIIRRVLRQAQDDRLSSVASQTGAHHFALATLSAMRKSRPV